MASEAFNDQNWSHYAEITSDNTQVDEAVGDLCYDLSQLDSTWWSNVEKADGGDVRVVNSAGDTAYSFELENFSDNGSSGTGLVFWDSQDLQTGSDTTWRIYIGNASASLPAEGDTLGKHNVWETNTELVHFLDEDPSGASPQVIDSTSKNHDGSSAGSMTSSDLVSGAVGLGLDFDGSDDYINIGATNSIPSLGDNWSISLYLTYDDVSSVRGTPFAIENNNEIRWQIDSGLTNNSAITMGGSTTAFPNVTQGDNDFWTFVKKGTNSGDGIAYKNGAQDVSGDPGAATSKNAEDEIGGHSSPGDYHDGVLSFFRIDNTNRSKNWHNTHYNNQNDQAAFWTTGATQEVSSLFIPQVNIMN